MFLFMSYFYRNFDFAIAVIIERNKSNVGHAKSIQF